jgi:inhibitor of KinA sporulation pathway (predicted exonuclease)
MHLEGGLKRKGLIKGKKKSKGYMKDNLPDWIEDSIRDLTKSYKNRLRVHRIQKIVRLFKIDVTKL